MTHPCVALEECCEFLDHIRRPVKESERVNGPYPYFGANGQQGWINDYLFDEPLVLLAEDGGHFSNPERGIAYKIIGKTWVNNHAHVLRPREGIIDVDYLAHALKNKDVRRHLSGSTRDKLTKAGACQIEIPLPPLEEQRRIAAILDKVALLIQSAAQAFCLSQELKMSLVHQTLRLATEGDERVRVKVRQVADMITGFPFKSAQYTDNAQHTRLCRGINVLPDRIEWKQVARWPEITPELRSYQIDEDDILIAMDRPWIAEGFKIARVKPTDIPSLLVQRVARIRAGNQILPRILFEVLSSKAFATHCTPTETTVPHISPIEIREYEFELPCVKEQKRIDSILAGIEKSQAAMNQRANLLKEKLCTLSRSYFN